MTGKEIVAEIEKWCGEIPYKYFYIGITDNINERLFGYHKPDAGYIHSMADNEKTARNVEKYFLNKGMQGGSGGGKQPTYVYVYLISKDTVE